MLIKPVLAEFEKSDGTRRVCLYIYSKGKKTFIPTEHYVKKEDWENNKVVKSHFNADYYNANIEGEVNKLKRFQLQNEGLDVFELKEKYFSPNASGITIPEFVDFYIEGVKKGDILNDGKPFAKGSIRGMKLNAGYFKTFAKTNKIKWEGVTDLFYDRYVNYLRNEKGLKDNSIARAIKVLKVIMKQAKKRNLHSSSAYEDFKASYQDVDTIALTEAEINLIMKAKLPKHLQAERDRFYLSYNLLLRFGDSVTIDKANIVVSGKKSFISIVHGKTKTKAVIPLFKKSLDILKKYNYQLPKTTNEESNWKLKEIGRLANVDSDYSVTRVTAGVITKDDPFPKYHFITTHTARRSMATNLYLNGFDLKQIQLMGGWKSVAVLEKYLKLDKLQNAMKASEHKFFK
jgi:site-specific recombinase XerD